MKFLVDENLSDKLVSRLDSEFPGSRHVKEIGLSGKQDQVIWNLAKQDAYVILTQDDDFVDMIMLHGPPPKVVHLARGNLTTKEWIAVLRENTPALLRFATDSGSGLLVIE